MMRRAGNGAGAAGARGLSRGLTVAATAVAAAALAATAAAATAGADAAHGAAAAPAAQSAPAEERTAQKPSPSATPIKGETAGRAIMESPSVGKLDLADTRHWVWLNDIAFFNLASSRAVLADADSGRVLGHLSTGVMAGKLELPSDYSMIYSLETHYARTTRGPRTDVVAYYDPATLANVGEVVLPPKRHSGLTSQGFSGLTDDDAFLIVYNFTPAQSVTVVDLAARAVAGEIATPGCSLVFPVSGGRFGMLCGDGRMLVITLDAQGKEAARAFSPKFFDPLTDPVTEKGVRHGDTWSFASFKGMIHSLDLGEGAGRALEPWSLVGPAERAADWRPGGHIHLAYSPVLDRLYSVMHQGGEDTHKQHGDEVWVYDMAARRRVDTIALEHHAGSLAVTSDDDPLLITFILEEPDMHVYDARTGEYLRTIAGPIAATPTMVHVR